MKNIKSIFLALIFILPLTISAQKNPTEVSKKTIVKTYEVEKGDITIPFKVKIKNKVMQPVKLKKKDKNKLNQDRVANADEMVTKSIWINSDYDKTYDKYIELSYVKDADDDFVIEASEVGFDIKVRGNVMNYSILEKDYYIDDAYKDFFIVKDDIDEVK
ncbi:hypothetical protein [Aquimarina brevivitae]|uniref:Uncharacterized protein n=1 Tax=Aquimarina brevivitae TaxID=323412 RepID=A0A4V2F4W7_9FLAO|nr:hypothetical protein [Aquimarina brevivitae]RZS90759.1 hypothetical protein EV197_3290 [Aquimarina brevivitae]